MKEMKPVCSACGTEYDLASWQKLQLRCIGSTGTGDTATSIVTDRVCSTCGRSVLVPVPLPTGTSETHAELLVQAALALEGK